MSHPSLFHESLEDALREVINAGGGPKVVACQLYPDKTPEAAHRLLLACLNEDRQERLSPGHVLLLLKMGRKKGCHAAMDYLAAECGYEIKKIKAQDERTRILSEFKQMKDSMRVLMRQMETVDEWPDTQLKVVGE